MTWKLQYKAIALPGSMSLAERISELKKEVQGWFGSIRPPIRHYTDVLRLGKHDRWGTEKTFTSTRCGMELWPRQTYLASVRDWINDMLIVLSDYKLAAQMIA